MTAISELWTHPLSIRAGWVAIGVLWESLALALLLATWCRFRASVEGQHRAALSALALCAAGIGVTPLVWAAWPPPAAVSFGPLAAVSGRLGVGAPVLLAGTGSAAAWWNVVAGIVGFIWLAIGAVLLARLTGGWVLANRVRRQAVPVHDFSMQETFARIAAACGIGQPVALLASSRVEAPVVVGIRHPAVIVPDDLVEQLGPRAVEPLLAHECAHVRRRDYVINLAQSIVDAMLWFSPGVHWISRLARETREYCCDDVAVAWCEEERRGYARVLASLAALGSRSRVTAVPGAGGPRLIARVRRLIRDDPAGSRSILRTSVTLAALALVLATALPVLRLSAAQVASASAAATTQPGWGVPIGWATQQPGSSVVVGPVTSDDEFLARSATFRNIADVPVTSLVLVAVVRGVGTNGPGPVTIVSADPMDVRIGPGATVTIPVRFMNRSQLAATSPEVGTPQQVFFGLARTVFANGAEWSTTPNPAARTEDEALSLPPGTVPRSLVGTTPRVGPVVDVCLDDQGMQASEGGVLPVRYEPGRFAVCRNGSWVNWELDPGRQERGAGGDRVETGSPGIASLPVHSTARPAGPFALVVLKEVRPSFPPNALREGVQGTVLVDITVSTDGTVTHAVVKKSLSPTLDAEAVKAARQWQFEPATKDGVAIPVQTELEFTFTITK